MFKWGKTPICLDAHETYYSFGAHSPDIVQEKLRSLTMPSLNYTVAGTLTFLHTQNKETICIVLSFDGDSVKARGSQRIFQSDTTQLLPCLSGLFPLSDLWHSSHRRDIGRLRPLTLRLTHAS